MESSAKTTEEPVTYVMRRDHFDLVEDVRRILTAAMGAGSASWAQKASIAALLHQLERLPRLSSVDGVELTLTGPRKHYDDAEIYFYLSVGTEDGFLQITFGGHFYRASTGGDSFTVFRWLAQPGDEAQFASYASSLGVLPQYVDPFEVLSQMAALIGQYTVRVVDESNEMLEDHMVEMRQNVDDEDSDGSGEEEESDEDVGCPVEITPRTQADLKLLQQLDGDSLTYLSAGGAYGVEQCDACGADLSSVGLFVDGNLPGLGWGNYCSACCLKRPLSLGQGLGQLYAQQADGRWLGVAGF